MSAYEQQATLTYRMPTVLWAIVNLPGVGPRPRRFLRTLEEVVLHQVVERGLIPVGGPVSTVVRRGWSVELVATAFGRQQP